MSHQLLFDSFSLAGKICFLEVILVYHNFKPATIVQFPNQFRNVNDFIQIQNITGNVLTYAVEAHNFNSNDLMYIVYRNDKRNLYQQYQADVSNIHNMAVLLGYFLHPQSPDYLARKGQLILTLWAKKINIVSYKLHSQKIDDTVPSQDVIRSINLANDIISNYVDLTMEYECTISFNN
jgi:hypothetical protein